MIVEQCLADVLAGKELGREKVLCLSEAPLEPLTAAADQISHVFQGNACELCAIVNAKSGRCSEDCRFCAQAATSRGVVDCYPLLDSAQLVKQAELSQQRGVLRLGLVTSGKRLSEQELRQLCESVRQIRRSCGIAVCVSGGLLDEGQYRQLRKAGVSRIHNNLESSRRYFSTICTTHSYDEKLAAIRAAQRAGLTVCSGGIIGLGETLADRIDLALELRELKVNSAPLNVLTALAGTPLAAQVPLSSEEVRRTVALWRFILPQVSIRLAGGRRLLADHGRACLQGGANALIAGDMLTTSGVALAEDWQMIKKLSYQVVLIDD